MNKQENISAKDKLMMDMTIAMSQYHSKKMSEAVMRGLSHRVKNGYAISRPPFGYSTTETAGLYKVNRYGRALRETLKKLANGETNLESATINIALMFYGSNTIKTWNMIQTKRLLSDPYYAGYISYKGQLFNGLHEPLITEDEHKKLLEIVKMHNKDNFLESVDKSLLNNYNVSMSRKSKK
jgi:site-specific DNA recombinase